MAFWRIRRQLRQPAQISTGNKHTQTKTGAVLTELMSTASCLNCVLYRFAIIATSSATSSAFVCITEDTHGGRASTRWERERARARARERERERESERERERCQSQKMRISGSDGGDASSASTRALDKQPGPATVRSTCEDKRTLAAALPIPDRFR